MELPKIHRERAVDAVYQALHQAITGSQVKPGDRLNIEELAAKLGVSLTPVRGAVQQLAAQGLVEIRPRSGTFVASLTPQDVDETFKIRCALECLAGEEAIGRIQPSQLRRLKDLLRSLKKKVHGEADRKSHDRDNSELHRIIVEASGNRRLMEIYEGLHAHLRIVRIHSSEENWPARAQEEQFEHEAIVAALEAGDRGRLASALRKHIYRAKDAMIAALTANAQESAP